MRRLEKVGTGRLYDDLPTSVISTPEAYANPGHWGTFCPAQWPAPTRPHRHRAFRSFPNPLNDCLSFGTNIIRFCQSSSDSLLIDFSERSKKKNARHYYPAISAFSWIMFLLVGPNVFVVVFIDDNISVVRALYINIPYHSRLPLCSVRIATAVRSILIRSRLSVSADLIVVPRCGASNWCGCALAWMYDTLLVWSTYVLPH